MSKTGTVLSTDNVFNYHLEALSGVRILCTSGYWYIDAAENGLFINNPSAEPTEYNQRMGSSYWRVLVIDALEFLLLVCIT